MTDVAGSLQPSPGWDWTLLLVADAALLLVTVAVVFFFFLRDVRRARKGPPGS